MTLLPRPCPQARSQKAGRAAPWRPSRAGARGRQSGRASRAGCGVVQSATADSSHGGLANGVVVAFEPDRDTCCASTQQVGQAGQVLRSGTGEVSAAAQIRGAQHQYGSASGLADQVREPLDDGVGDVRVQVPVELIEPEDRLAEPSGRALQQLKQLPAAVLGGWASDSPVGREGTQELPRGARLAAS